MKIYIGSDHGGFDLKESLIPFLNELGHEVEDLGTHSHDSVDYPNYGKAVGEAVVADKGSLGIVICGTGIGISIAANKVKGVRAALCSEEFSARMARQHNDSNVLALGGRTTGVELAKSIVEVYLTESFQGDRHARRVDLICSME